ncbi:hypothetical protein [Branchiibius cervicis]|uniref:MFS transporter n=1 Tax=Branchiibius cervicis TaxID=908252 RepID=A0ABW2APE4_9MICO
MAQTAAAAGHLPTREQIAAATHHIQLTAQTYGSTHGFWASAMMVLVGTVLVMSLLTIKHGEMAEEKAAMAIV